jgi:hypothetical protein
MTREDEWRGWCARFDETHNVVILLFHNRAVWRTIREMIDTNPAVQRTGFAENWLARCYTTTQLVGIRRECDGDKGSIGLRRSLKHLASTPRIATRAWYRSELLRRTPDLTADDLAWRMAGFDDFAQPGAPFVDPALVNADIELLEAALENAETYTNKVIAHRDDIQGEAVKPVSATWGDLDGALNTVGQVHKKYYKLRHAGTVLWNVTPLPQDHGWDRMFETAWKAPGFIPPDDQSFDA